MPNLKEYFLLDPDVIFLNHGSFGAAPKPVFAAYQDWQHRLERQPVLFLGRELDGLLYESRQSLGKYLNTDANDLVYIPNATHGVNIVARSLQLEPGDEILTTDHEYGACDYTWEFTCARSGAVYTHQPIPLPAQSQEQVLEQFWQGVTPRTRVIYLSHITSPTAMQMPVAQICQRARVAGILTVIDAAHAPGQIPVDLKAIDADFVFGNLHKWSLAPKGAAFLYARRDLQSRIDPLVVSWGYHAAVSTGSQYVDYLQWTGTRDPSAYLAVPDAIQFMETHLWEDVRRECHHLLVDVVQRICDLTALPPLYPLNGAFASQMAIAPLPADSDLAVLKSRLYDEHRIEVPLIDWQGQHFVRISVQAYNTPSDLDALADALKILLPQVRRAM